ncbi:MAG: phenylalanine--tRNA ligase beta subunit-related protein, partial [Vicinamibacterales bacterium]
MKVPLSWLREFVDVPGTADEIAATMSVRGLAVESVDAVGDDLVLDFETFANRPDTMSIAGIAREVATAYGLPLKQEPGTGKTEQSQAPATSDISVAIDSPDRCSQYAGAVADVTVGPSPGWMQARLTAAGVRPISNIVDITNYVLLELGQPMHAFDLATLAGAQIRVRTAAAGETLKTLDGQMRALTPDMLVIADAGKPCAVAGVMGGADSEVSAGTRSIVFESAHFNAPSVRRTSRALGLKTEASMRFERGTDPALPRRAMQRACELLTKIGAGTPRGAVVDCHPVPVTARTVALDRARIPAFLGVD